MNWWHWWKRNIDGNHAIILLKNQFCSGVCTYLLSNQRFRWRFCKHQFHQLFWSPPHDHWHGAVMDLYLPPSDQMTFTAKMPFQKWNINKSIDMTCIDMLITTLYNTNCDPIWPPGPEIWSLLLDSVHRHHAWRLFSWHLHNPAFCSAFLGSYFLPPPMQHLTTKEIKRTVSH